MRTRFHTLATADAFRGIRLLVGYDIHLAGTGAHTAPHALLRVHLISVKADAVKQPVERAQRADVSAKRSEHHHGKEDDRQQNHHFPRE